MNNSSLNSKGSTTDAYNLDALFFTKKSDVILEHPCEIFLRLIPEENFFAIVAIDKTANHPTAFGGTRFAHYASLSDGIKDAQKLARAMTYKAAFANLPFSGGKVVLIKPSVPIDRSRYFSVFGKYIESINGKMVTGCDSGVNQEDMKVASQFCRYLTPDPQGEGFDGLSWITALGVKSSLDAAVKFKLKKDTVKGMRVLVQGIGKVGWFLAKLLKENGAIVTVTDINMKLAQEFASECGFEVIEPALMFDKEYDIFAPCAIGGVVSESSLSSLKCHIICGAANNILANLEMDTTLFKKDILYVPDFAANVGGAVFAGMNYLGKTLDQAEHWIMNNLEKKITDILSYSQEHKLPTEKSAKHLLNKEL